MGRSHLLSKSHCHPDSFPSDESKSLVFNFPHLPSFSTQTNDLNSTTLLLSLYSLSSVKEHGELKNKEKLSGIIRDMRRQKVTGDTAKM